MKKLQSEERSVHEAEHTRTKLLMEFYTQVLCLGKIVERNQFDVLTLYETLEVRYIVHVCDAFMFI